MEHLRLGTFGHALIRGQDNGAVEVLVAAVAQMVKDTNDEDAWRLLAEVLQVLCVTLDKETNCLLLDNCNHVLLIVAAQEVTERSGSQQDVGKALVVVESLVELHPVDVLHGQIGVDLREADAKIFTKVVLERCEEGDSRTAALRQVK